MASVAAGLNAFETQLYNKYHAPRCHVLTVCSRTRSLIADVYKRFQGNALHCNTVSPLVIVEPAFP